MEVTSSRSTSLLDRHYSTIGVEDVFLDTATSHPLPVVYLQHQYSGSPFTSLEIVGTIKSIPEDFCVREILTSSRRIPGLSDEEHEKLKIADILQGNKLPKQQFNNITQISQSETTGKKAPDVIDKLTTETTAATTTTTLSASLPPDAMIRSYLEKSLPCIQSLERTFDELNRLNDIAKDLLMGRPSPTEKIDSLFIWLPPHVDDSDDDTESSSRLARGDFHRALKAHFPLLYAKSTKKESVPNWIEITIDNSYDELIPFLLDPACDIPAILSFQKEGLADGGDSAVHSNQPSVVLRLVRDATKEQRKLVHLALAKRSKLFNTSTITDYELPDGGGTITAIRVTWDKRSVDRKRKRNKEDSSTTPSGKSSNPYPHILFVLMKQQKEHLTALHAISRTLRCRESDIGIAGIKDMHAVTYQFCTLRHTRTTHVEAANRRLEGSGIVLSHFYQVDWLLNNGDLDGNEFVLVVRDLKRVVVADDGRESQIPCEGEHIKDRVDRLRETGFINFFGEQRVGSAGSSVDVGVRAFDIGRAMLQQNFAKAVDLMMTGRHGEDSRESDAAKRVRQIWKESGGDAKSTLKAFHGADNIMTREKIVLKGLNRFGNDKYLEAIRCLSYSVRTFWINAYQSLLWNQAASMRIQLYGTKVVEGDLYHDDTTDEVKVVGPEVHSVHIGQVVLPLPGQNIVYPENEVGALYKKLLSEDDVSFDSSGPPESSAKGTYRRLVVTPSKLDVEMIEGEEAARLRFQLPKGSYATMLLRELMRTTCTRLSTAVGESRDDAISD